MSGHSSHNALDSTFQAHGAGAGHETADVTFKYAIWLIPVCMLLLVVYVGICWFGATASLTREMARKQTLGAEAGAEPLKAFRAQEDSMMQAMPIDHAMQTMAKEAGTSTDSAKTK